MSDLPKQLSNMSKILLNVYKCSQMSKVSQNVPKCLQMFFNIYKYPQMSTWLNLLLRTLIMEQRNHLIHTLRENKKKSKIRKFSLFLPLNYCIFFLEQVQAVNGIHPQPAKPDVPMTWSAEHGGPPPEAKIEEVQNLSQMFEMKPDQPNLRRMHNAVRFENNR